MKNVKKLSMTTVGAAFIALGISTTVPATAASLNFSFSTESGGTGSFTLDTDTAPATAPGLFRPEVTGVSYPNAISDFSFSAPYINVSSVTTDWNIVPSITSDFIGFPSNLGVISGVSYPPGCITAPGFSCLFNVAVFYSGNRTNLTVLSDEPNSYSRAVGVDFFDPTTQELLIRDEITNLQVVPEPNSALGILAFGIGGVLLLLKRKMSRKGAAIKP